MADGTITITLDVDGKDISIVNKDLDQLEGKSKKAGTSIKDMAVSMGLVKVASAAFNVLKGSLDSAISRFDTMQKFPKVMNALGFSAEDSKKSIDKLSKGIDGLPTKLDDVVASTQQMTAITNDLERSTDTVLALNNAFLASGASAADASRGTDQFNQMLSTGTVDLQSWKTLQETMPLALQKTAEAMGYTGKSAQRDLYSALQEGNVTFDQFNDKIIELGTGTGMLADLAKENSLGIATSLGNLKNAVSKNLGNMITKFDEIVQKMTGKTIAKNIDGLKVLINDSFSAIINSMELILPTIDKIKTMLSNLGNDFPIGILLWGFDVIKSSFTNMWSTIMNYVPDIIGMFKSIWDYLQPVVSNLISGFTNIAAGISRLLQGALPVAIEFFISAVTGIWNVVGPIAVKISEVFEAMAFTIVDVLVNEAMPALQNLMLWLSKNQDKIIALGEAVAIAVGVFATLTTVVSVITKVIKAFKLLKTAVTVVKAAFLALQAAMLANPIGIIVVAISVLVGVIMYLWKTNEGFRDAVISIWEGIKETFSTAKDYILKAWETVGAFFSDVWNSITEGVDSAVEWVKNAWSNAESFVKNAWNSTVNFFGGIWDGIKEGAGSASEGVKSSWNGIKSWFDEFWTGLTETVTTAWGNITNAIMTAIEPFVEVFSEIWTSLSEMLSGIWEGIQLYAQGAWELIKATILGPILLLIDLILLDFDQFSLDLAMIWESIKEGASLVWEGLKTIVSSIVTFLVEYVTTIITFLADSLAILWENMKTTALALWDQIVEGVKLAIANFVEWAQTTWANFNTFLSNLWESIKLTAESVWTSIQNSINNLITSMVDTSKNTWNNFRSFLSGLWPAIQSAVTSSWNSIKNTFSNTISNIVNSAQRSWNTFKQGVQTLIDNVKSIFSSLANINLWEAGRAIINGFIGGLKGAWESGKEFIGGIGGWIRNNKGPISYDRKLLIPAGNAIMGGFDKSLRSKFKDVQKNVSGMADDLAYSFNFPQIQAESLILGTKGGSFGSSVVNNRNVTKTINNQPQVVMHVSWQGKEDIRNTMEKMGWIVNLDERGLNG